MRLWRLLAVSAAEKEETILALFSYYGYEASYPNTGFCI
jgi:hypothetical protein